MNDDPVLAYMPRPTLGMEQQAPGTIPYYLEERIRALIVEGEYRPGQPLREQDLESRFGTSRSPIREALRLLEQRGLVTHTPRRGFRVTLYSDPEIRDQYLLRAELEAYAIMRIAECDELPRLLDDLGACHDRLVTAYAANDPRGYLAEIRSFYSAIAQHTGNKPLCKVLAQLNETAEPMRFNLLSRKLKESESVHYTLRIIRALKARDFATAAQIKREHVLLNLPSIIQAYAEARYEDG